MSDTDAARPQEPPKVQPARPIDIQKLAEKVYQLMLADLRRERARSGSVPRKERG
jgi:hypothetical protein